MMEIVCRCRHRLPAILVAIALLLPGCTRSRPVAYYQLTAIDAEQTVVESATTADLGIGLGPVRLPEILDRPQIVIRSGANRMEVIDGRRWIEPPADNISRVLRENLAVLLATERIVAYPWNRTAAFDYQISIEILRFEGQGVREAQLEAVWSVRDRQGKSLVPDRRDRFQVPSASPDYEGLVRALSETLSQLCREISREIRNLPATGQ
ncbi:MAG: PqiC family protein [Desulfoprunum sp.]